MLDHSNLQFFITNLNSISPCSSLSMHIDLMTSLHAINQGTVLKMPTEIHSLRYQRLRFSRSKPANETIVCEIETSKQRRPYGIGRITPFTFDSIVFHIWCRPYRELHSVQWRQPLISSLEHRNPDFFYIHDKNYFCNLADLLFCLHRHNTSKVTHSQFTIQTHIYV